jgi:hypothetical protein
VRGGDRNDKLNVHEPCMRIGAGVGVSTLPPVISEPELQSPETQPERAAIANQLETVLESPGFKSSRRACILLRYIVERTLEGQTHGLKERILGAEVFGRKPDYDTGSDHIVRSTASDIRKRLAQYYLEPGRDAEIRIEVLAGSYIPQFRRPESRVVAPVAVIETPPVFHDLSGDGNRHRHSRIALAAVAAVCVAIAGLGVKHIAFGETSVDRFWGGFLESPLPVAICMGDPRKAWDGSESSAFNGFPLTGASGESPALPNNTPDFWFNRTVPLGDAITLSRLTALISEKKKDYRIVYGPDSTLNDLRQNSTLLIGGIDNFWTMNLTRDLPYRFQLDPVANTIFIEDRKAPARRDWQVAVNLPRSAVKKDYALVARVLHPATGRPIVIAGGIRDCGTLAVGEFLTSASSLNELERRAPARWTNFEAVISTTVLKGAPGPPQIVAASFW